MAENNRERAIDQSQEKLISMLKEVDDICRENDITYFLDGGTALGAIRHNGIIPWDNDADLVFTEENYNKFIEVVNRDTEKTGRTVQNGRINRGYQAVYGKYIDLTATKLVKATPFWDEDKANAGMSMDIFFLIPLPKDKEEKEYIKNLLYVYIELQLETRRYTGQSTDRRVATYRKANRWCKIVGKERVLKWMEKKLFNRHYDDFDEYLYVSSPRKYPRVFPREFFDTPPVRLPFNGLELPVSAYYLEEMRMFYGDDYWENPAAADIKYHADEHSDTIPYKYFIRDFVRLRDPKLIKKDRELFKAAYLEHGFKKKDYDENVCRLKAAKIVRDINKRIEEEKIDLVKEVEAQNWELIDSLFSEFYRNQYSKSFKYQWYLIPLTDEQIYAAMMNLIENSGRVGRASWYPLAYKYSVSETLTPMMQKAMNLLDCLFNIQSNCIYERWELAKAADEDMLKRFPESKAVKIEDAKYHAMICDKNTSKDAMNLVDGLLKQWPDSLELIKAKGDVYWNSGDKTKAMECYDRVFEETRNGFAIMDIRKKKEGKIC